MGLAAYAGYALASVGTAGLIFSGNDAVARIYKYVTNKELLAHSPNEQSRKSTVIKISVAVLSLPVFISGVVSGIYDDAGRIQSGLGYFFPALAPAPPRPAPAALNPCEDLDALGKAEDNGYDALILFFRACPFVNSKTEHVVREASTVFMHLSDTWLKSGQMGFARDATRRAMTLSEALVTYTMTHNDVQLGARLIKGDPETNITISPWPDPQAYNAPTAPIAGRKPFPQPATKH